MIDKIKRYYNNNKVTLSFIYDDNGKDFKTLLESCYKDELNRKRIKKK